MELSKEEQSAFWNQTWNHFEVIKQTRGEEAAHKYLRKIIDRLTDVRAAGL